MNEIYPPSLRVAVRALENGLAEDLRILDVREVSTVTDYFMLATGNSRPHLQALAEGADRACKAEGIKAIRKTGGADSGWSVLDYGDVMVHIMTGELREFYALERLWSDGKTVDPARVG